MTHGMKEFVMEAGHLSLVSGNYGGRRELTPDSCPSGLHTQAVTPHDTHTCTSCARIHKKIINRI